MATNTPMSVAFDSKWRAELKQELLNLIRKRHPAIDRGLQFEGVSLSNPDDKSMAYIIVLQEILQEQREFSLVQWPGGIALVKTGQVDRLDKSFQDVNETANFIIRGGSDKASDLLDRPASPLGAQDNSDGTKENS